MSDTHQSELINCGKPYYDGRAVLDAGVIRPCGHDTREKLEADVCARLNNMARYSWRVDWVMETARGWLNRQAAITDNEWYDEVYQLEKKCDQLDRESDQFEMQYKEQVSRCDELRHERDHMRKACADMVSEMWHAYDTVRYVYRKLRTELDHCVELPRDADGVTIYLGDRMDGMGYEGGIVTELSLTESGWTVCVRPEGFADSVPRGPSEMRHWHPRGKDGKPIVRGDVVYGEDGVGYNVTGIVKDKPHCVVGEREDGTCKWMRPEWLTHERPVTVADVLEEFAREFDFIGGEENEGELWDSLLDKYAAKLRLAGDGE